METVFNSAYLVVVWWLVAAMLLRWKRIAPENRGVCLYLLLAFGFLALGDTGHVGFRIIAFVMGGLDANVALLGIRWNIAALGAAATAWTFTVFYVCMLFMWKSRFNRTVTLLPAFLILLALVRAGIMLHPANSFNSLIIVEPWFTVRNIPLLIMQAGTAFLLIRDAVQRNDRLFLWIGLLIVVSLACYAPVVALVKTYPAAGMLMIPKTMAYLAIAVIGYRGLFCSSIPSVSA